MRANRATLFSFLAVCNIAFYVIELNVALFCQILANIKMLSGNLLLRPSKRLKLLLAKYF